MFHSAVLALALAGLLLAIIAWAARRILRDFSRHELEAYCRRARRRERFKQILDADHRAALAFEALYPLAVATWFVAGTLWATHPGISPTAAANTSPGQIAICIATGTLLLWAGHWVATAVFHLWAIPLLFHLWPFARAVAVLMWPAHLGLVTVEQLLRRLTGRLDDPSEQEEAFEEEMRTIVSTGLEEGLLEEDAREMIEGVMDLRDVDVADIMTPRSKVDALDIKLPWAEMLRFVSRVQRTRIPVYRESLDNIVGVLYAKDVLPVISEQLPLADHDPPAVADLVRSPWKVPPTMRADDLLQRFRRTRNHMAIVVDEYQAFMGVVTIEDALEEIVGEIVDEHDADEEGEIQAADDGRYAVLGKAHVADVNGQLGLNLPESDDFDTIGGLVISRLGRIPQVGDAVICGATRLTVAAATPRRVDRLWLEQVEDAERETA